MKAYELAENVESAVIKVKALEEYMDSLQKAQDAIEQAQFAYSQHDLGDLCPPCSSEVEECRYEAEAELQRIEEILSQVEEL